MKIETWTKHDKSFTKTEVKGHIEVHRPFMGYDHNPVEEEDLIGVCVMDEKNNYFPVILKFTENEARLLAGQMLKAKRANRGKLNTKTMGQFTVNVNAD